MINIDIWKYPKQGNNTNTLFFKIHVLSLQPLSTTAEVGNELLVLEKLVNAFVTTSSLGEFADALKAVGSGAQAGNDAW